MPDKDPELRKKDDPEKPEEDAQPEEKPKEKEAPGEPQKKPKKKKGFLRRWIRFNFMGFLLVLAVLAWVFYMFFLDPLVALAIRSGGSRAVGAKVEVEDVYTSFFPPTLKLTNFRAANPERPMFNATEAKEIVGSFDPFALFSGRLVIDDMTVRELQFDTPRETSGALEKAERDEKPVEDEEAEREWLPTFEKPDIERILEEEELKSVEMAKAAETDIEQTKEKWEAKIDELRATWEKRKEGDWQETLRDPQGVAQFRREVEELRNIVAEFNEDVSRLRGRVNSVKEAAPEDAARLKEKYALDPEGISNMALALFGEEAGKWTGRAAWLWPHYRQWRARARDKAKTPPKERRQGQYIVFGDELDTAEAEPVLPRLVIKKIHVSVVTPRGAVDGEIENVTDMPSVLGEPTRFAFNAETLEKIGLLSVQGMLDHVDPDNTLDTLSAAVKQLAIDNLDLGGPVELAGGLADIDLAATIRGADIEGLLESAFKDARFGAEAGEEGESARLLTSALAGVRDFVLKAVFDGTVDNPGVKVEAGELDQAIRGAVEEIAAAQAGELEAELRQAIQKEVGGLDERLGELAGLEGRLKTILEDALGLRKGAAGELLDGVLGGSKESDDEEKPSPVDRLKGILGR